MLIFAGALTFVGFLRLLTLNPEKENIKSYAIISGLVFFLIGALRNITFLFDTVGYVDRYLAIPYRTLGELWSNSYRNVGKDPFFYFFAKIISMLGIGYQGWLAILIGIFCIAMFYVIYKYSDEAFLSIVVFVSLGYFTFGLTGLRQSLAFSFILFSYQYLRERKLYPFLVLIFFAAIFHSSSLIFVIAYPIANMKINWKQVSGVSAAIVISYFFAGFFRRIVSTLGWTDIIKGYAEREITLSIAGFLLQLVILLFCLYYKKNVLEKDEKDIVLYNLLFLGLTFQGFAIVIAEMFRVSMYFSIFSIILIPKAIMSEKDGKTKQMIYFFVFLALVLYLFYQKTGAGYTFFWQH